MSTDFPDTVEISIVVPMLNETAVLDRFFERLVPVLEGITAHWEILCVDDGSTDGTFQRLEAFRASEPRIRLIGLSRNFGKENALSAGLDFAAGLAVIPMDADLQDPPELVPQMVAKWREGFDVVLAKRMTREGEGWAKRTTAQMFYRLIGRLSQVDIPENVGDFRLMDRRVVEALANLPERSRFMKGVFAWLGFRQAVIDYAREPRAAGEVKQNWGRLFALAVDGIVSFSAAPLKVWSYLGFAVALFAGLYGAFIILRTLVLGVDVPGYPSLLVVVLFMNGLVLIGLGVIGEYLARIFIEVKRRPVYVISAHAGVATLAGQGVATRRLVAQRPEFQGQEGGGGDGGDDRRQRQPVRPVQD
ncbi:MAG TPA: glycosyltransferase family 2 protein [Thermohalobaculum sp.]|nr:glycosyltransferase family 2 protein [Thermohalobaculum sp.]